MLQTEFPREDYLQPSPLVDMNHPAIVQWVADYEPEGRAERKIVQDTFEFVRDQVHHSWDIRSHRVTAKASEVLHHQEGICYAKSHLLAALLRKSGVPTGFCYQRLTLGDTPETGYCIHALNTVYLSSMRRWIRLDARGNKPGVDAQFSVEREHLAFPVRPEYEERDYETNYPQPHPKIVEALMTHQDCLQMYTAGLPKDL
jgi:transglutaminase-like putative cysteine protease